MTKSDIMKLAKRVERQCNNPDAVTDDIIDNARFLAECVIQQLGGE